MKTNKTPMQKSKTSKKAAKSPAPKSTAKAKPVAKSTSKKETRSTAKATSPAAMLKVVSSRLKRGDISRVAGITGYEQSHVGRVLRGVHKNPSGEIVTEAYRLVTSR